jgi:hypothetical protein
MLFYKLIRFLKTFFETYNIEAFWGGDLRLPVFDLENEYRGIS